MGLLQDNHPKMVVMIRYSLMMAFILVAACALIQGQDGLDEAEDEGSGGPDETMPTRCESDSECQSNETCLKIHGLGYCISSDRADEIKEDLKKEKLDDDNGVSSGTPEDKKEAEKKNKKMAKKAKKAQKTSEE